MSGTLHHTNFFIEAKFLDRIGTKLFLVAGMALVAVGAVLGVNANIGGGDLPELQDGDNNNDDYEEV